MILIFLTITKLDLVWQSFGGWMMRIMGDLDPNEAIISESLKKHIGTISKENGTLSFHKSLKEKMELSTHQEY
jgi:hypothetical protein